MKLAVSSWPYWNPETLTGYRPQNPAELMSVFRDQRDVLLKESDWCVGPDSPLDPNVQTEWTVWRQSMRDITKTISFVDGQEWVLIPDPPVAGRPKTWVNVDFDYLSEMKQRIEDSLHHG